VKKTLFILFILCFVNIVFAQSVDSIVKKNIFDPKRGVDKKTETEDAELVKEELPKDMPILDGIIVVGKYKKAIFRFRETKTRKMLSTNVKEGENVGEATVKKISTNSVIIVFQGKAYEVTVDSKYEMANIPKKAGRSGNITRTPNRAQTPSKRTSKTKGRSVKPVRKSTVSKKSSRKMSTPFGTARSSSKSGTKRKNHPF